MASPAGANGGGTGAAARILIRFPRRSPCTIPGVAALTGRPWEGEMLLTLALILFVAWLLGLLGVYTIGSIVHVLLVIALVLFLIGIISGRRTVV